MPPRDFAFWAKSLWGQLCDNHHGFTPLRSCVTQLLQLVYEWLTIRDERWFVDAIFLDFAKDFDKVSHLLLLLKLHHYGIKGQSLESVDFRIS